jgi:uncharacterized protein YrrD
MRQLHRLGKLKGHALNATDGEIGTLQEVYFDDSAWIVRYFVVRTGTWLGGREVLISPRAVRGVDSQSDCLDLLVTREKVRNSPLVGSQKPVSRHHEEEFFRYYQWERYWISSTLLGSPEQADGNQDSGGRLPEKPEHPHLCSSHELTGYSIHARDGDIGHVADLIIDDQDWKVCFLEVNTWNWLPGKHVLVAPAWIREVNWFETHVAVDLERAVIETAPPYDPGAVVTPDDEVRLYNHYAAALEKAE